MKGQHTPWLVLMFSSGLLLSSAVYLAAYWRLPSDGTMLDLSTLTERPGLLVHTLRPDGGLATGDLVVAVDGQPLDAWMRQALWPPWQPLSDAAALDYTVIRGDETLVVRQPLRASPLAAVLAQNWTSFLFLVYLQGIGFFVFAQRPYHLSAQTLLVFSSCLTASSSVFFVGLPVSGLQYGWLVWLWIWGAIVVYTLLGGTALYFTTIFPRPWLGQAQRRATWTALVIGGAWLPLLAVLLAGWSNAAGPSARLLLAVRASSTMAVVVFPLGVLGAITSYRRTRAEVERRQVRWILWALLGILPWVVLTSLPQALGLPAILPPLIAGLLWCALPTAFAIAILREGLFDIDVLINRSLVYGGLTLVLAAAYLGGVVALQSLFRALTGEQQSQLATVLSTLAIAALFSPVRARLQSTVDRRFYRRKYDAARTLAMFGATLRDEVDLNSLAQRLVGAVEETMEPAHVGLWLRPAAAAPRRAEDGRGVQERVRPA